MRLSPGHSLLPTALTLLWETFLRRPSKISFEDYHAPSLAFALAPLVLTGVGTAIPFLMEPLGKYLFDSTAGAIAGAEIHTHLKLWHGFTTVLTMSLIAIGLGIVLFFGRNIIRTLFDKMPDKLNGNYIFERINDAAYDLAFGITRTLQGSSMSIQVGIIFGFACSLTAFALLSSYGEITVRLDWTDAPRISEVIVAALAVVAAITTVRADTRVSAIIALGVVGVTVMLFFIFFSAPDLALTQLLIEVLTVVLLMLVFMRVRPTILPAIATGRKVRALVLSLAMGLFGFTLVLLTSTVRVGDSIHDYFVRFARPAGYGNNVVNVILVDFRSFDTLGEITVLAIAAMGGYALLRTPRLRDRRRQLQIERQAEAERQKT